MRIGIVSYDFYPPIGGQGVEAYNLYNQLQDEVGVVVSSRKNKLSRHISFAPPFENFLGQLLFSLHINMEINKIIEKYKLDLVQFYGGPGGVFLFKKLKIPIVYVANHTYAQQHRFFGKKVYKLLMKLEKIGYNHSEKIIAISSTTKKSLVEDYGIDPSKIEVIPVGVSQEFRNRKLRKIPNSILYVGRLHKRKGIPNLIRSVKYIKQEIPDIKLYIVGQGDLEKELKLLVDREDLTDAVVFLGKVSEEELIKWYNKAEIFVMPSIFEGFGISCAEAMACGTPVVATRVPGIVDIVKDGENGFLVNPDEKDLSEKIITLLKNKNLRKKFSEIGLETSKEFNWKNIAKRFITVYEGVYEDDKDAE